MKLVAEVIGNGRPAVAVLVNGGSSPGVDFRVEEVLV